ncbi:hypothetical protein [Microbacterium sp.]|uniref:hypothetical protein n=1 Tax=Microbacterium sp. TaxID=51671 RepID=UPI0035B17533
MNMKSLAAVAVLATLLLSGCSATTKPSLLDAPEGYQNIENELAIREAPDGTPCSISSVGCRVVEAFAIQDCPNGAYIEARVLDGGGVVIGMTNATLPALKAGDYGRFEMLISEAGAASTELSTLRCN